MDRAGIYRFEIIVLACVSYSWKEIIAGKNGITQVREIKRAPERVNKCMVEFIYRKEEDQLQIIKESHRVLA